MFDSTDKLDNDVEITGLCEFVEEADTDSEIASRVEASPREARTELTVDERAAQACVGVFLAERTW